jgi:hypothetical protein
MKGLASVVVGPPGGKADMAARASCGTCHHFRRAVHLGKFASLALGGEGIADASTPVVAAGRVLLGAAAASRVRGTDDSSDPAGRCDAIMH